MSRLKDNLPDSLELLLDTMCNTFGGIMFIALSLVIISQLVTDKLTSASAGQADQNEIKTLQQSVALLEENVKAEELKIRNYRHLKSKVTPDLLKKQAELEKLNQRNRETEWLLDNLAYQLKKKKERKEKLQRNIADLQSQIANREKNREEKEKELKKELDKAEKELAQLEDELSASKSRSIKFGIEEKTCLSPYLVLIQNNKIYRMGDDYRNPISDVSVRLDDRRLIITPLSGTAPGSDPDKVLHKLFEKADKSEFFIWLSTDKESFATLMMVREFLRAQGFRVRWDVEIQLYVGGRASHRASF